MLAKSLAWFVFVLPVTLSTASARAEVFGNLSANPRTFQEGTESVLTLNLNVAFSPGLRISECEPFTICVVTYEQHLNAVLDSYLVAFAAGDGRATDTFSVLGNGSRFGSTSVSFVYDTPGSYNPSAFGIATWHDTVERGVIVNGERIAQQTIGADYSEGFTISGFLTVTEAAAAVPEAETYGLLLAGLGLLGSIARRRRRRENRDCPRFPALVRISYSGP